MPITASQPIGLAFCGMVEEAPRWWPPASRTSPTSVLDRSTTSRAKRAAVAASDAQVTPNSATPSLATCQGTSVVRRPSRPARPSRTSEARSPIAADVPPAPNSDTTRTCRAAAAARSRCRAASASSTASFAPNVVGTACWAWVRAATTVPACVATSPATASPNAPSRPARWSSASPICSARPVSMMSCVVAP